MKLKYNFYNISPLMDTVKTSLKRYHTIKNRSSGTSSYYADLKQFFTLPTEASVSLKSEVMV